jgi:AsmA protein
MKYLKWLLFAVLGLVILFIGAVIYIATTFDPNQYKTQLTTLVKESTQRTLTIEGDIRLMFFPRLGVQLGKTHLSEFKGDKEFAGVDDVRVSLVLLPLLAKQVIVDKVQLNGLRANLVKHKNGKFNFDDLLGGEKRSEPAATTEPAKAQSPIKLEIDGVEINKAALHWKDETSGSEYAIADFNLKTGRVAPGVPTVFELSAAIQGNEPKVDLRLRTGGTLRADFDKQVFSLKAVIMKATGEAAGITGLSAELQTEIDAHAQTRQVDITALEFDATGALGKDTFKARLSAPKIGMQGSALTINDLAASATGVFAGVTLSESRLRVPHFTMHLDNQTILVDSVTLSAKGIREADRFEARLDAPKINITRDKASGSDVILQVKAQGPQLNADASVRLSGVEGSGKSVKIGRFTISIDARQAENAIKGSLSTPILANLEIRSIQLPNLAGDFVLASPDLPMKKLKIALAGSLGADMSKQTADADLAFTLDDSHIKAKFAVSDFKALRSTFDIAIDKLNVDKYLPPKAAAEPTAATPANWQAEKPIDFSPIKKLAVSGTLKIGELVASKLQVKNLRVNLNAMDGRLTVDPLAANLYQGSTKGSFSLDANTNAIAVRQELADIAIGPLLRDLLGKDLLEGRGNVSLDLTTSGNLVSAMTKALNGTAKLDLRNGAIKGINLGQALGKVKSMISGGKGESEQPAAASEKTLFSELSASFDIKNGIAHNGDFLAVSPVLRMNGEGDVNLPESSLDYLIKASASGSRAPSKGLTLPVRAYGPFVALKYKLDFGSAMADAAREKIQEQKDAVKEKVEEQKAAAKEKVEEKKEVAKEKLDDKKDALKEKLDAKLTAKPEQPAASGEQPAAAAPTPADKLKEKLKKKLF